MNTDQRIGPIEILAPEDLPTSGSVDVPAFDCRGIDRIVLFVSYNTGTTGRPVIKWTFRDELGVDFEPMEIVSRADFNEVDRVMTRFPARSFNAQLEIDVSACSAIKFVVEENGDKVTPGNVAMRVVAFPSK